MSKPAWLSSKPVWVEEKTKSIPIQALNLLHQRLLPEIQETLGDRGVLVQAGLRYRSQQMNLANAVAHALRTRRHLIAQAGTGCGKSIGYAVPAILHALDRKERVVIATSNKLLQDQIVKGDLPLIQERLAPWLMERFGRNFKFSVLYGRDNYLCLKKFEGQRPLEGIAVGAESVLQSWAQFTQDGLLADSGLNFKSRNYLPLKLAYTANQDDCPGQKKCEWGSECYYYQARRKLEAADILVVNHAVLVAHQRYGLLPDFGAVIVDEAHNWEDALISSSTTTINIERFYRLQQKVASIIGDEMSPAATQAATAFFLCLNREIQAQNKRRIIRQNLNEECQGLALKLKTQLRRCAAALADHPASLAPVMHEALEELELDITCIFDRSAGILLATETKSGSGVEIVQPDVSEISKSSIAGRPWIFTSATLSTSENYKDRFGHFRRSLGITHCDEIDVGSPFDYARQQLYYIPPIQSPSRRAWLPDREAQEFAELTAEHYKEVLLTTQGRALLLFTSYLRQQAVHKTLLRKYGTLPWPARCQGGDDHEQELIAWFRSTPNAVLFAVTLWEGIDVPGSGLVCTIMDRFPLPPPDDPVLQERQVKLGGYHAAAIPRSLIKAKQGAGRTVRAETDRGLVVIMDTRLLSDPKLAGCLQQLPGRPDAPDSPSRLLRRADLQKIGPWLGSKKEK